VISRLIWQWAKTSESYRCCVQSSSLTAKNPIKPRPIHTQNVISTRPLITIIGSCSTRAVALENFRGNSELDEAKVVRALAEVAQVGKDGLDVTYAEPLGESGAVLIEGCGGDPIAAAFRVAIAAESEGGELSV
jgi:hypothetical protein